MFTKARETLLLIAIATLSPIASAATYQVDESHTSAVFSISHLGYSYTYGMFQKASGSFEFDKANPTASSFNFVIDVASINTMNDKRDEHLRNADFFDAAKYPQITFQSTRVEQGDQADTVNVTGKLTMHGVTKEVTLPLKYLGEGKGPYGNYRVGFLCQATIKRSDFGMNFMVGPIGDNVGVTVSFEGLQQ